MAEPAKGFIERLASHGYRYARRVIVAIVGGSVVLIGIVMFFTPGPAIIVIPAGLAILATEFAWARRLLKRIKDEIKKRTSRKTEEKPEIVEKQNTSTDPEQS